MNRSDLYFFLEKKPLKTFTLEKRLNLKFEIHMPWFESEL